MQRSRVLFVFLFFSLSAGAAPLTWDDCVQRVIKHNEELQAQISKVEEMRYRVGVASHEFYPEVTGSLNYSENHVDTPTPSDSSGYGANITLNQNLFAGFATLGKRREAQAHVVVSEKDLEITKARISKELKVAFENYLFALNSIELRKSIVARRQENVRLVELRFQGGRENRGSVLLSKANLAEARFEETQARFWLRAAKATLAQILAWEDPETLEIVGEVPLSPTPSPDILLRPLALETPSVEKARAEEEAIQGHIMTDRSDFFPALGISAGVNRADEKFFPERDKNWNFGVTLSIPLFKGGRDYYELKAQTQMLLSAIQQRNRSQKLSFTKLEEALSNLLQAAERVNIANAYVEAANVRAEIGRMRYNNGLISFDDWYIIENELIDRQKQQLDSRRDRVHHEAAWEEAQGKGVIP